MAQASSTLAPKTPERSHPLLILRMGPLRGFFMNIEIK